MSTNSPNRTSGNWSLEAILRDFATAWRLFWSPRVPATLKLILPIAALIYWLSPLDLLPGLPFDDVAVLILALRLFVQMAPADVAQTIRGEHPQPRATPADDENTIDTTWRVVDQDKN
jgi:uncharacterized membrane protein YkvA (DUF1232 family)